MEKFIIDERNGWEYELKGEQYYPTGRRIVDGVLTPSELPEDNNPEAEMKIGIWGQRHSAFLKQHQRSVYDEFFISGILNAYLAQIDQDAQKMFDLLVRQIAELECVTETLKVENQMDWIQRMNSIRQRAMEIVNNELIYI